MLDLPQVSSNMTVETPCVYCTLYGAALLCSRFMPLPANSLMQSALSVTANVHIPWYISQINCLENSKACSHSHMHLTISRSTPCNISQQVPFHPPPSVTVPKTQHNTYFYTSPLYERCKIPIMSLQVYRNWHLQTYSTFLDSRFSNVFKTREMSKVLV